MLKKEKEKRFPSGYKKLQGNIGRISSQMLAQPTSETDTFVYCNAFSLLTVLNSTESLKNPVIKIPDADFTTV